LQYAPCWRNNAVVSWTPFEDQFMAQEIHKNDAMVGGGREREKTNKVKDIG
jgi:hypothetical protein